jgi:predicted peptidase
MKRIMTVLTAWLAASLMAGTAMFHSALAHSAPVPDPKSPQYQGKGEQDRSYEFPGTGEQIAYHLYVPTKWTPSMKLPLVIVTHGAAQPEGQSNSRKNRRGARLHRRCGDGLPRQRNRRRWLECAV